MTEKEKRKEVCDTGKPGCKQKEAWQSGNYGFTNIQRKEARQAEKTNNQIKTRKGLIGR